MPDFPLTRHAQYQVPVVKSLNIVELAWRAINQEDGCKNNVYSRADGYRDDFINDFELDTFYKTWSSGWNENGFNEFKKKSGLIADYSKVNSDSVGGVSFDEFKAALGYDKKLSGVTGAAFVERFSSENHLPLANLSASFPTKLMALFSGVNVKWEDVKPDIDAIFADRIALDIDDFQYLMTRYNLPLVLFDIADSANSNGKQDGIVEKSEFIRHISNLLGRNIIADGKVSDISPQRELLGKFLMQHYQKCSFYDEDLFEDGKGENFLNEHEEMLREGAEALIQGDRRALGLTIYERMYAAKSCSGITSDDFIMLQKLLTAEYGAYTFQYNTDTNPPTREFLGRAMDGSLIVTPGPPGP